MEEGGRDLPRLVIVTHAMVIGMLVRQLLPRWIGSLLLGCCSALSVMTLLIASTGWAQEPAVPDKTKPIAEETPERQIEVGPKGTAPGTTEKIGSTKKPVVPSATPEQIAEWVKDLDSDYYLTRERATESLAQAGPGALEPLAKAADSQNLEVATRAVRAMFEISQANEGQFERAALESIAKLENRPGDRSAAQSILNGLREREAIVAIKELGGIIEREYEVEGEVQVLQLRLGVDWKGGDEKMSVIADLKSLRYLMLHGAPVTDAGLTPLHEMKQLIQLQVYGTNATPEGAAKLRDSLPNTEVHFRLGALLGIKGMVGFQGGAMVESVQEDTAAEAADLRRGDMIVKYGDVAINSFEELTDQIAKCKPGDKATLELVREGQKITKEITFGAWK